MKDLSRNQLEVSDLKGHVGFWLRFVSNHVSYAFARKLLSTDVTVAEWVVLREMYDAESMAPSRLAEATGLTRGAVSKLVDRLFHKELLTRIERDDDRRYQTIALTEAGRKLVPKLAALADENDAEFFSALTPRERQALIETLRKLVEANRLTKLPTE
ncbi:MarR family winged helix-turn-helix transcriptional regulator [Acidicapsa acidisoli]|uniref:MarR family winged helix-turn-helix transcriptional regulator n=1 Tax=Acidicapsa acidisoli TaxID=1615681 RepID=UPI0021DFE466|nr:MarR family transcriptional regulator [Acidicapsa acidisoli]